MSEPGRQFADTMEFLTDGKQIAVQLGQVMEFRRILENGLNFPSQDYYDLIPLLAHLKIPGTFPEPEKMAELRLSLITLRDILRFLNGYKEEFPLLSDLAGEESVYTEPVLPGLIAEVEKILNEKGQIRDSASPALADIRREMKSKAASVEKKILQTMKEARQNGWTPEEAEVTVRNGRLVIPVLSAHKRRITGFVHDESATGQTIYLEPAELFETNNELRALELAERREIIRILTRFADALRPEIDPVTSGFLLMGKIDFIRSKAVFALDTGGVMPTLQIEPPAGGLLFSWRDAIHPLLFLSHRKQGKKVVPLNMELTASQRILVISGPNAGGKSVCLKTVGLVQYMLQSGILPTLREDSTCCIFDKVFLDIGDEQSIDNDLSTYTSKLINLRYFLLHLDNRTLFLIDEFGTGTDPSLGGPIAEASLETMAESGACGVVTTHYSNLKLLAGKVEGIVNGAMLYDTKKLKPLFQLQTGRPGSSFAFEIAGEVGFPADVLQSAMQKTGYSQLNFERQMQELETEKAEVSKKITELRIADEFIGDLIRKYEKMVAGVEKSRKEILGEARGKALQLLADSNRIIEKTVKEIRESQAEKEKTKSLRKDVKEFREQLEATGSATAESQIAEPQDNQGSAPDNIKKGQSKDKKSPREEKLNPMLAELNRRFVNFQTQLDLRGKRVDEAYGLLQRFIDEAIMLSIPEIRILHGKGNGVLRQVTRDYTRGVKEIKSAKDEALEAGGSGITVITFR